MYPLQEPARANPLLIPAEDSAALRHPTELRLVRSSSEVPARCRARNRRSRHPGSPRGWPQSACPCAVKKSRRNGKPAPENFTGVSATAGEGGENGQEGG